MEETTDAADEFEDELEQALQQESEDGGEEQEESEVEQGEQEIDMENVLEETAGPASEDETEEQQEGFGTAIDNAFGRILTLDLDPEKEKTNQLRKQLQGLAEDVRLGHNANRFLQKYVMTGGEPDPKTALFGSAVAAFALALAIRPELFGKVKAKLKGQNQPEEVRSGDEEDA